MPAGPSYRHRRALIQLASVVVPIGLMVFVEGGNNSMVFGLYFVLQSLAGLDVILLLIGRFSPRVTLIAIRVEAWLGPLPWKRHD